MKAIPIILVIILLLASVNIQAEHSSTTIYVDDIPGSGPDNPPEDFTSIQEAIDVANDGDTIYVYNGMYYENIIINKSITLQGENKDNVIIDGKQKDNVTRISSSNVNINQLTITNSSVSSHWSIISYGIIISEYDIPDILENIIISDCNIIQNDVGIMLMCVQNVTINNCTSRNRGGIYGMTIQNITVTNCYMNDTIYFSGKYVSSYNINITNCIISGGYLGIGMRNISDIIIQNNTIKSCGNGLELSRCKNAIITECDICDSRRNNIYIKFSHNISINNCYIDNNATEPDEYNTGVRLYGVAHGSHNISITNCMISNNVWDGIIMSNITGVLIYNNTIKNCGEHGLYVRTNEKLAITNNIIHSNKAGIYIENSNEPILIKRNDINSNEKGIYFRLLKIPNKIIQNNFINNTYDVDFFVSFPNYPVKHIFRNNYWSQRTTLFGPELIYMEPLYKKFYSNINIDWFPARLPHLLEV